MHPSPGKRLSATVRQTTRLRVAGAHTPVVAMTIFIALLHLAGWATLLVLVVPLHASIGSKVFGLGTGLTAYMLGVRHAFDADHIAAIDNTTRKLVGEGRRSLSVGFWFSFGHASIVFGLTLLIALGAHALSAHIATPGSAFHTVAGRLGAAISGGFLYLIAAMNIVALFEIWAVFRKMRTGRFDEASLEHSLHRRGLISRMLGSFMQLVRTPGQMYFVGLLFGLGFDTATEIALLVLSGSGAAAGLPWYATLCLPVLFAAGMLLFDTIDGSFMNFAYGWALLKPVRKVYYNLVVTGLSVAVALVIGSVEILGLLGNASIVHGALASWASSIDLNRLGFAIVALFMATWAVSVAVWKFGRIERRWMPGPPSTIPAIRTISERGNG